MSLRVAKGETLALVGANGAGKTTLLRAIAGAHPPTAGSIRLDGEDVTARARARARRPRASPWCPKGGGCSPQMTVEENLLLGRDRRPARALDDRTVLEAFPNLQSALHAKAGTLSGGEQQATAIGRALMSNPDVLLLDEVSLGLSPLAVDRVYASLDGPDAVAAPPSSWSSRTSTAPWRVADRVVCMLEGRIVLEGQQRELTREQVTEAYFGLRHASREARMMLRQPDHPGHPARRLLRGDRLRPLASCSR